MSLFDIIPKAPSIRPALSVGGLFDIVTGNYHPGKNGECILNGGMAAVNSVAGPGNTFKSEILNHLFFTPLARYSCSKGLIYDTENSMTYSRLNRAANVHSQLKDLDVEDDDNGRVMFSQSADVLGDVYFEYIKTIAKDRIKNSKKLLKETPFVDDDGNYIKAMEPLLVAIDSLSELKVSAIQDKLVDKNAIGESGANTQFMKDGGAKTQMITQLPNLGTRAGIYFYQVAHVGMPIVMDQYAPVAPKLSHSKRGMKTKGVPEKFDLINSNLFEIFGASFAGNSSSDKSAKYPKRDADRDAENKDLMSIHIVNTRNKNGPSGVTFEIFVSQSAGLLVGLTMFNFLKEQGNYGLNASGNNSSFASVFLPDLKFSRTTVREKIDSEPKLERAIEIATQMRQMEMLWSNLEPELHCSPVELYEDIKKLGYDWDVLLATRNYWVFNDDEASHLPYLSTKDLLNIRLGRYHPKWYPVGKDKLKAK